jgi:hypothetical protein
MLTHERDSNASDASSPPEDREFSDSSTDKGKSSCRSTRQCVIKRCIRSVVAVPTQDDDSIDDFDIPPSHAKKHISPKASTKGGGREKRFYEDDYF